MTQDTKKLLKTDFGKQLDELFFRTVYTKNDFKTPTTFLAVYTEYNFSQKERVDITNILVDYLHYGKVKGQMEFVNLVIELLVRNKTPKALTELMGFLFLYFVKGKKNTRFNKNHIKLISKGVTQMISSNLHEFGKGYFTEERRTSITNSMCTLINSLFVDENKEYSKEFSSYWIKGLKSFSSSFSRVRKTKKDFSIM